MNEIDVKIVKLLKEDPELKKQDDEFNEKWLQECEDVTLGRIELTREMFVEKIEWLETLIELAKLKEGGNK